MLAELTLHMGVGSAEKKSTPFFTIRYQTIHQSNMELENDLR